MTDVAGAQIILASHNQDHETRIDSLETRATVLEARGPVGYAHRATSSTAASAAQGVLRVSSLALTQGVRYRIYTDVLVLIPSVNDVRATARLSHTVNNTNAGTGSTLMALVNTPIITSTADGYSCQLEYTHTPAGPGEILSVCLWTQRLAGTGTVQLLGVGAGIQLHVDSLGIAVADTGTDL